MEINNTILKEKHLYMQILTDIEAIRKQEELNVLQEGSSAHKLKEANTIWLIAFAGLIREGLKYDYIKNMADNTDIVRLTIDGIQFDCNTDDLKKVLKKEYDSLINAADNIVYMGDDITLIKEIPEAKKKSDKEIALEKEIKELKEQAKKRQEEYMYEINHDAMTGLKNKKAFTEDTNTLNDFYLVSMDANELKVVNDALGHAFGDKLLVDTAHAIKDIFGEYTYRTGGDEFYAIIQDVSNSSVIKKYIEDLKTLLSEMSNEKMTFSISAGYAFCEKGCDKKECIVKADEEMYKDKKNYRRQRFGNEEGDRNAGYTYEIKQHPVKEEKLKEDIKGAGGADIQINMLGKAIPLPEEPKEIFNYGYEKYKDVSTFVYDTYDLTILAPGSSNGENVKALIAPLKMCMDNNHAEIMCMLIDRFGEVQRYVSSPESPTLKINFKDYELIIRGTFVNGEFNSYILASGSTLAMGFGINKNAYVPQRSANTELTNYGHLVYEHKDYIFHVVPLSKNNDLNGIAPAFICVETPDKRRKLISTNENAITLFEDAGNEYQILTYWQNNTLCSEVM